MATSVIVELCGPPGSGKSRVAHALTSSLVGAGVAAFEPAALIGPRRPPVARQLGKLRLVVGELLLAPVDSLRAVQAIVAGQPTLRDRVARSTSWLAVRGLVRRSRRQPGVHIFDQGVLQELGSIAYRGAPLPADASRPGRARLGPDVLVHLDVTAPVCAARLADRPGSESRVERTEDLAGEIACFAQRSGREADVWEGRWGQVIPTQVLVLPNEAGAGVDESLTARLCALARGTGAASGRIAGDRPTQEAGCER